MQKLEIASDEPLSGYLSRLAESRGVRLWDFRIHMGIRSRRVTTRYYETISAMTGIDPAVLKRHDLVRIGGTFEVLDMTFDVNDIWAKSARACPCCIQEDVEQGTGRVEARPRLRFGWMLRTLGRCAIHGVPLIQIGPDYDRFSIGDFNGVLGRNRDTWNMGKSAGVARETDRVDPLGATGRRAPDVYFQDRIATTASHSGIAACSRDQVDVSTLGPIDTPKGDDLQMLDDMPVPVGLLLTEVVGGMELFGDRYRRSDATDEERQVAVVAGYEFTRCGYAGLSQFLKKRDQSHWRVQRRGSFRQLYGTLQETLSSRVESASFEKVTSFVAEHAYANHALGPEDIFLGYSLPRRLYSIRTAEVAHGIHRVTLRRILKSAGLLPPGAARLGDGRVVVEAEALETLIAGWQERLPTEEAKARLGISGAALKAIVERGLLLKDDNPNRQSNISRKSFEELTSFLERLPLGTPCRGMKRLTEMVKIGRRTYGEVIGLIIDGTIKNVIRDAHHDEPLRFDSIFVDPVEVKAASPRLSPPGITLQLAEAQLGTTRKTVEQLVASGLLESITTENPATGKSQTFILPDKLEEFQKNHISLFLYAKGRGQIGDVKKRLADAGVMPAFEKAGVATFYRKDSMPSE
ncbi:TniQ family protein [Rhizobium nepotum]|uniref:TniQ domain-containing protein n=1 Tax=Rhizobium nepotum 39/7 TaxID=1368418 RepID=A0ABR5CNY8_9HYPH|nr:TniQ family protein [Rhizobium nepotum]KJF66396.1 hypothetical protein RS75_17585 [Rhizobium nepotum 39/7]